LGDFQHPTDHLAGEEIILFIDVNKNMYTHTLLLKLYKAMDCGWRSRPFI
jgi:hypothetical protein